MTGLDSTAVQVALWRALHVELDERYFAGRNDGLHLSGGEELVVART